MSNYLTIKAESNSVLGRGMSLIISLSEKFWHALNHGDPLVFLNSHLKQIVFERDFSDDKIITYTPLFGQ